MNNPPHLHPLLTSAHPPEALEQLTTWAESQGGNVPILSGSTITVQGSRGVAIGSGNAIEEETAGERGQWLRKIWKKRMFSL